MEGIAGKTVDFEMILTEVEDEDCNNSEQVIFILFFCGKKKGVLWSRERK